jgi:hypothetical protein
MLVSIATCSALLLGCTAAFLAALDHFLTPAEAKRIAEFIDTAFLKVEYADSMAWVQLPLRTLRQFVDAILGTDAFGMRAAFRASMFGTIILITALSTKGMFDRSSIADLLPLRLYEMNVALDPQAIKKKIVDQSTTRNSPTTLPTQSINALAGRIFWSVEYFHSHRGLGLKVAYCSWAFAVVLGVNACAWYMSVTATRQLLRELEHVRSILSLLLAMAFSLTLCLILGIFSAILLGFLLLPSLWSPILSTMTLPLSFLPIVFLSFMILVHCHSSK